MASMAGGSPGPDESIHHLDPRKTVSPGGNRRVCPVVGSIPHRQFRDKDDHRLAVTGGLRATARRS